MKKIVCVLAMIVIITNSIVFALNFSDLSESHWAYNNVLTMQEKGIVNGFEDGTFRPNQTVTREQFAKMLVKTFDLKSTVRLNSFEDVEDGRWSKNDIKIASSYFEGYFIDGKMYFKPTEASLREDVAIAVVKAKGLSEKTPNYSVLDKFSDKDLISPEKMGLIAIAVEHGIMNGNADGTFNPQGSLTRAQAVTLLSNAINSENKNDISKPVEEMEIFTEYNNTTRKLKYGMRDKDGNVILKADYDFIVFLLKNEPLGVIEKDGKYGCVDRQGNIIIPVVYDEQITFYNDSITGVRKDGKYGCIDRTGKIIVPIIYDKSIQFRTVKVIENRFTSSVGGSYAEVLKNGVPGIVDRNGKEILFLNYDKIVYIYEENKMIVVKKGDKYGCVNCSGKEILSPIYDSIGMWAEDVVPVCKDKKYGYFDINGKQIIEFKYDSALAFYNGVAEVKIGEEVLHIDKNGNEVKK